MSSSIEPHLHDAPSEVTADEYVGRRVAKSAAWMVMKRFFFKSVGLISTLILVRILAPEAFGLAAIASVAFDVLDVMTEFSLVLALVKMKNPTRAHFDTAWTLLVMRGFLIGALMYVAAPFVADFMNEPRLVDITRVLALLPVVQGFESVGLIYFRLELRFDRIFWYEVTGKLIGFAMVIPAAFILQNAWAVVIGYLGPKFIMIPISYWMHPYRPRPSLAAFGELFNFSKWLLATNVLALFRDYTIVLLLGKIGGPSATGLYQQAWQIAALPASEIAAPIRQPMYSGYAKVLGDMARLRQQAVDGLSLMLMIVTPLSVGLALTADWIQPIALGPKWVGAAPLIQICALYALVEAVGEFTHNIYVVLDRQKRYVGIMALTILIRTGFVIWAGINHGILWAAAAMALTSVFSSGLWFFQVTYIIHLSLRKMFAQTWRTGLATLIMIGGVLYLQTLWPQSAETGAMFVQFAAQVAGGGILYIAAILTLWRLSGRPGGPENHALLIVGHTLPRLGRLIGVTRTFSAAK